MGHIGIIRDDAMGAHLCVRHRITQGRQYLSDSTAESGMPMMKAPATERPWKIPMLTARLSGGDASIT